MPAPRAVSVPFSPTPLTPYHTRSGPGRPHVDPRGTGRVPGVNRSGLASLEKYRPHRERRPVFSSPTSLPWKSGTSPRRGGGRTKSTRSVDSDIGPFPSLARMDRRLVVKVPGMTRVPLGWHRAFTWDRLRPHQRPPGSYGCVRGPPTRSPQTERETWVPPGRCGSVGGDRDGRRGGEGRGPTPTVSVRPYPPAPESSLLPDHPPRMPVERGGGHPEA